MTVVEIDWGDRPDWRDVLKAAQQPLTPAQDVWDGHWCRWRDTARRTGKDWRQAVAIAWTRTEAQYGQRPSNEETK